MGTPQLSLFTVPGIPLIKPGDDLAAIMLTALAAADLTLTAGDVIVIAQKLVSKAENRIVSLNSVTPSQEAIDMANACEKEPAIAQLILDESNRILRQRPGVIIAEHKLGFVLGQVHSVFLSNPLSHISG